MAGLPLRLDNCAGPDSAGPRLTRWRVAPAAAAVVAVPAGRSPTRRRYCAPNCAQALSVGGPIAIGAGIGISIAPEIKNWWVVGWLRVCFGCAGCVPATCMPAAKHGCCPPLPLQVSHPQEAFLESSQLALWPGESHLRPALEALNNCDAPDSPDTVCCCLPAPQPWR